MPKPRWLDDLEFRAWIGYRRLRLLLDAEIARDLMSTSGLSMPDYDVLSSLSDTPGGRQRLSALAARMLWSKSRLSRHISRMESRGLVARAHQRGERRWPDVVLTDQGRQTIVAAAPEHVESVRAHFIDVLTEEQLRVFAEVSESVLNQLATADEKAVTPRPKRRPSPS